MFALWRALFVGGLVLVAMIPVGFIMLAVGLPIVALVAVVAIVIGMIVAVIGLPFMILGAVAAAVIAVVFGLLAAVFSIWLLAVKLAVLVLLPVLAVGWIAQRIFRRRPRPIMAGAEPVDHYQQEAEAELDRELR